MRYTRSILMKVRKKAFIFLMLIVVIHSLLLSFSNRKHPRAHRVALLQSIFSVFTGRCGYDHVIKFYLMSYKK